MKHSILFFFFPFIKVNAQKLYNDKVREMVMDQENYTKFYTVEEPEWEKYFIIIGICSLIGSWLLKKRFNSTKDKKN